MFNIATIKSAVSWRLCAPVTAAFVALTALTGLSAPSAAETFRPGKFEYAEIGTNSCRDLYEVLSSGASLSTVVRIVSDGTTIFTDSTSNTRVVTAKFGEVYSVVDAEHGRIQIEATREAGRSGWIDPEDLLCEDRPISVSGRIEGKYYIRTSTSVRGEGSSVVAWRRPEGSGNCPECLKLSRFSEYFVYQIRDRGDGGKRFLLGKDGWIDADDSRSLIGWVDEENGFLWESGIAARPAESLGNDGLVCFYPSPELALADDQSQCLPVLGGPRWYKYPFRMPVLERTDQGLLEVVFPVAGTGLKQRDDGSFEISGTQRDLNVGFEDLTALKNVDVMFVIDGTYSMQPHIDAIRGTPDNPGVVQRLGSELKRKLQGITFRFGYRMYRDQYAGDAAELNEGLALSAESCGASNEEEFLQAIATVAASSREESRADDYPENSYGGLMQAIRRDISSCPDNLKVVIVIGDAGYDAGRQASYGRTPIQIDQLAQRLRGDTTTGRKSVVTFFMQTDDLSPQIADAGQRDAYRNAYTLFTQQAEAVLRASLPASEQNNWRDYLLRIGEGDVAERATRAISQFSRPSDVNFIMTSLQSGASLVEAIEQLRGQGDVPGLFLEIAREGSCMRLGPACENRVYDHVFRGFILDTRDRVDVDLLVSSRVRRQWVDLLEQVSEVIQEYTVTEVRESFLTGLAQTLGVFVKQPRWEPDRESLEVYLEREAAVPLREKSPLLALDTQSVAVANDCELLLLSRWFRYSAQILDVVSEGNRQPLVELADTTGTRNCRGTIADLIPNMRGTTIQTQVMPPGHSYVHSDAGTQVYWVPEVFFP